MQYLTFKQHLREFIKGTTFKFPLINNRHKLHRAYENSLFTAPVPDDEDTLYQFLKNTDWDDVFSKPIEDYMEDVKLAPLPKAVPQLTEIFPSGWTLRKSEIKEEGKTLMRYNDNYASANACVTSPQSDAATQRDFLLTELARADYPKQCELSKLFNLYVDNTPKTYKDMIDIIKAGTYTIDAKIAERIEAVEEDDNDDHCLYGNGPMYGIVWPGPVADFDSYKAAQVEKSKQYAAAKRIIMTGDAAAGLKALQDFEAWLPVGKAN